VYLSFRPPAQIVKTPDRFGHESSLSALRESEAGTNCPVDSFFSL